MITEEAIIKENISAFKRYSEKDCKHLDLSPISEAELDQCIISHLSEEKLSYVKQAIYMAMNRDLFHKTYITILLRYFSDFGIVVPSKEEFEELAESTSAPEIFGKAVYFSGSRKIFIPYTPHDYFGMINLIIHEFFHAYDHFRSLLLEENNHVIPYDNTNEARDAFRVAKDICIQNFIEFSAYLRLGGKDIIAGENPHMRYWAECFEKDKLYNLLPQVELSPQVVREMDCSRIGNELYCNNTYFSDYGKPVLLYNFTRTPEGQRRFYPLSDYPLLNFAFASSFYIERRLPLYPPEQQDREFAAFYRGLTSMKTSQLICPEVAKHNFKQMKKILKALSEQEKSFTEEEPTSTQKIFPDSFYAYANSALQSFTLGAAKEGMRQIIRRVGETHAWNPHTIKITEETAMLTVLFASGSYDALGLYLSLKLGCYFEGKNDGIAADVYDAVSLSVIPSATAPSSLLLNTAASTLGSLAVKCGLSFFSKKRTQAETQHQDQPRRSFAYSLA